MSLQPLHSLHSSSQHFYMSLQPLHMSLQPLHMSLHPLHMSLQPLHMSYVTSAACLRANVYGVALPADLDNAVLTCLQTIVVKEFVPKAGVRIDVTDSEAARSNDSGSDSTGLQQLIKKLVALKVSHL